MSRITFAGVFVELLPGWYDVTDGMPSGTPFTLSKGAEAVGALQFTVGTYKSGPLPELTGDVLVQMMNEFFQTRNLGIPANLRKWSDHTERVSADSVHGSEFVRVWYVAESGNIALLTFTSFEQDHLNFEAELSEAEAIAHSVRFQ